MEFKRWEVRRTLRYREQVEDKLEVRKLLESIKGNGLKFSMRLPKVGACLKDCSVVSVNDEQAVIFARSPQKVRLTTGLLEIEAIEVESNCDFLAEDKDDGGRWARII